MHARWISACPVPVRRERSNKFDAPGNACDDTGSFASGGQKGPGTSAGRLQFPLKDS
jgi:hypothetical protein